MIANKESQDYKYKDGGRGAQVNIPFPLTNCYGGGDCDRKVDDVIVRCCCESVSRKCLNDFCDLYREINSLMLKVYLFNV